MKNTLLLFVILLVLATGTAWAQTTPLPEPVPPPQPIAVPQVTPSPPPAPAVRRAQPPEEALRYAIERGDKDSVTALLTADPTLVNRQTEYGSSPLATAVQSGSTDIAELLIAKGAEVDAADRNGRTPLSMALQGYGDSSAQMLSLLLAHGASLKTFDSEGLTPLHLAVKGGSLPVIQTLLDKGIDVNIKSRRGDTPLHLAAASERRPVLELLLDKGALVNARNSEGDTPLHAAMHSSYYGDDSGTGADAEKAAMEELLIEHGAQVNARDRFGLSPLLYSLLHRDKLAHALLVQHRAAMDTQTAVFEAASQNDVPTLSRLLKAAPLLVSVRVVTGDSPLHVAALWGARDTATLLLKMGADVNARNAQALSPLHLASRVKGNGPMVTLLLLRDANSNAADLRDDTPLHKAVRAQATDAVTALLTAKADPNALNEQDETPLLTLLSGISYGENADTSTPQAILALLLKAGADPNFAAGQNNGSSTPLSRAVQSRSAALVSLLLDKGANVNAADGDYSGETPLMRAVQNRDKALVTLLLAHGADASIKTRSGDTALSLAKEHGNSDIVDLLNAPPAPAAK